MPNVTCPDELTLATYADGELAPDLSAGVSRHIAACAECRERVALLTVEGHALRAALHAGEAPVEEVPDFERPSLVVTWWLGGTAALGWAINVGWSSLAAATLPQWIKWLAPDATDIGAELVFSALGLLRGDTGAFEEVVMTFAVSVLIALGALVSWWLFRRHARASNSLVLLAALVVLAVSSAPAIAFEIRHDEDRVTIPASETIDDTLLVTAEHVLVDGTVTGDVIAFGEQVTIRGDVAGAVVAAGEEVTIEGRVGGNVYAAGETLEFHGGNVAGNLLGAGQSVTVDSDVTVGGNAALAGEEVEMRANVRRDLAAAGRNVSLLGSVGGDFRGTGEKVELAAGARVAGDLRVSVGREDNLIVAPDAVVAGETSVSTSPVRPNRYLRPGFYAGELMELLAAFVFGALLFLVFPSIRDIRPTGGREVLVTGAIGAGLLIATPVLAVAAIVTLIGAPVGILVLLGWIVAVYSGMVVAADALGRGLLGDDRFSRLVSLLVGLGILTVLVNVPGLGGLVMFLALAFGLGTIGIWLRAKWMEHSTV